MILTTTKHISKKAKFKTVSQAATLISVLCSIFISGCLENQASPLKGSTTSSRKFSNSTSTTVGDTSSYGEAQCSIFSNNTNDYNLCLSCKNTLCATTVASCSLDFSILAQCVHDNLVSNTTTCSLGFTCGTGQIPDSTTCSCKDATPRADTAPAPGYEDTLTPYLEPGFTIGNRYCRPATDPLNKFHCLGATVNSRTQSTPLSSTISPPNVFTDVGYLRWDLGMDASQFPQRYFLENGQPFLYSTATLAATMSLFFQLKPNTKIGSSTINWRDCPDHFSGYAGTGASAAGCSSSSPLKTVNISTTATSGTATLNEGPIALNGPSANGNIELLPESGNPALTTAIGTAKTIQTLNTPVTEHTGMLANIGNYKFSFGPVGVRRPSGTTDIAAGTVSGRVAINTNLGYSPASAVDSTAFSDNAILGSVSAGRSCAIGSGNTDCVVTAVYRGSGGSVLTQNYGPQFINYASAVESLPSGVVAVSTPKIIEDVSQFTSTQTTKPARLRVFVRGADGNIHMSMGSAGKWNSWTNLGRPWTASDTVATAMASVSPVYLPFTPAEATAIGTANPYSGTEGNGISIASEPVVASYMDTSVATASDGADGYIAVFVRVSNLNIDGTAGSYHNAVFYTFARTTHPLPTSNTTALDFDTVSNWSRWRPVHNGATLFQIQGNPTAVYSGAATGTLRELYVFGTENTALHAPITERNTAGFQYTNLFAARPRHWFNYRSDLRYMAATNSNLSSGANWAVNGTIAITTGSIVSDWSIAPIHGAAHSWRLIASEIWHVKYGFGNPDTPTLVEYSPREYARRLRHIDATLNGIVAIITGSSGNDCDNTVYQMSDINDYSGGFFGTPMPIYLLNTNATHGDRRESNYLYYIFGRSACKSKANCDVVNPTFTYATVNETSTCVAPHVAGTGGDDYNIYRYGENFNLADGSTANAAKYGNILPLKVTSDVIPTYSAAMHAAGVDVPVILLTRDAQGKLNHGIWEGKNNGATGNKRFYFYQSGAFTN